MIKKFVFLIPLFICLLFISGCKNGNDITASGNVEATEINIAAKVAGRVEEMAKEGDRVEKDKIIVRLDRKELEEQVAQAEAAFEAAKIQLEQAKKAAELQESQHQNQLNVSESSLGATEAQLNQAVSGADLQFVQTDSQIGQAQVKLQQSLDAYNQAKEALKLQVADTSTKIEQAKAAYEAAQEKLDILLEGARPQEKEQAQAAYNQALANYENARKDLERAENLFKDGVIPEQQLDKAKTLYTGAESALKIAEENLSLVKEGPRSQEIEIAKQQLEQAKSALVAAEATESLVEMKKEQLEIAEKQVEEARIALELAQAGALQNNIKEQQIIVAKTQFEQASSNYQLAQEGSKLVDIKKQDVDNATAMVKQREAALELAKTQLANSEVKAPVSGTVTLEVAEIGELVPAGSTVIKMADLQDIWISVYIPEDLYGKIKLKDKALVTVDSWKGEVFEGYVSYIASEAQFTPKNIQTKKDRVNLTYEVKVKVDNKEEKLIPGMPADVEIITEQK